MLIDAVPAVFQLVKVRHPGQRTGLVFLASFTVPKATCSAVLKYTAPETGTIGVREAMLVGERGLEAMRLAHPYAPDLAGALPYTVSDSAGFDPRFPTRPLSRARVWAARTAPTVRLDATFAQLRSFQAGSLPDRDRPSWSAPPSPLPPPPVKGLPTDNSI